MRVELTYQNRLARQLRCKEVKAKDLFDEKFYMLVVNRLKKEYKFIQKSERKMADDIKNVKNLMDYLAFEGIKHLCDEPSSILGIIGSYNIDRQMKFRMKEKVKKLLTVKKDNQSLVDELNNRFDQSLLYYR